MVLFLAVLFTMPAWGSDYVLAMACIIGIHVIATLGLNLTTGNAGLISLAHGAFLGVGCYTAGVITKYTALPSVLTLPLGGLMAALIGSILILPVLRTRGH